MFGTIELYLNTFLFLLFYWLFLIIIDQCKSKRNYKKVTVSSLSKRFSKSDQNGQIKNGEISELAMETGKK